MDEYVCSGCGQEYYVASGNPAPTGLKWTDGHKCSPVKVEEGENDGQMGSE